MIYRAAAAYPYVIHAERAAAVLRGQLRLMALAGDGSPDWSTLVVEGPTKGPELGGTTWFEWIATVSADGGRDLTRDLEDDDLSPSSCDGGPAAGVTMPQPRIP